MLITYFIENQLDMLKHWHSVYDNAAESFNSIFDSSNTAINTCFNFLDPPSNHASSTYPSNFKQSKLGTAVVTGGMGGIGTAICKRLATDGNRVISTCLPEEMAKAKQWKKTLASEGFTVEVLKCDVTDYSSCQAFAVVIEKKFGDIDILVNCAGITRDALLRKMDKEKWDTVLKTNLDSVFNITRCFINGMIKNNYGRIINISSVNGQKGQFGQTNYSTAKAGMIGFTRSLALEMADRGITVNCVCPGYVSTPMVQTIRKDILDGIIEQIPMGRLAKTEEVADAVAFLADNNSGYITGTEIAVNGGLWLG